MAFVKLDKATDEWVNLDYVVKVDISGDGEDRVVRVWLDHDGSLVPYVVARGVTAAKAAVEARKLVEDRKPQARSTKV